MDRAHNVLVVEDDGDIREAISEVLAENGFVVSSARNGLEALDLLRAAATPPCVILLDLMMPVMDGISFRQHQTKDPALARIPVVVVSAFKDGDEKAQAIGADAYLKKPLSVRELVSVVSGLCEAPVA